MAVTPFYGMTLPDVGGSVDVWGGDLNTNLGTIDTEMNDNSTVANWAKDTIQGLLSPDYDWEVDGDLITRIDATEDVADGALQKTGEDVVGEGTMTGRVDVHTATTKFQAIGSVATDQDLDLELYNYFNLNATDDITLTFINCPSVSDQAVVAIIDITSNGNDITFADEAGTIYWAYGDLPTLSDTGKDVISFITLDGGANWSASVSQADVR